MWRRTVCKLAFRQSKIDVLKLKLNPLILGEGIKLFGQSTAKHKLQLTDTLSYENGLQIMTYNIIYDKQLITLKARPLKQTGIDLFERDINV